MVRAVETNLEMIRLVAEHLGDLRERVVFLGGAATALLITDKAIPDVRITTDVDVIVEIASRGEYYLLAESLRFLGFKEDVSEDAPVCRWRIGGSSLGCGRRRLRRRLRRRKHHQTRRPRRCR